MERAESIQLLVQCLADFLEFTETLWAEYQALGPGNLRQDLFAGIEARSRSIHDSLQSAEHRRTVSKLLDAIRGDEVVGDDAAKHLLSSIEVARELAYRCACTETGLSFVTGEAGLIPRKDQHAAMDRAIETLHQQFGLLNAADS